MGHGNKASEKQRWVKPHSLVWGRIWHPTDRARDTRRPGHTSRRRSGPGRVPGTATVCDPHAIVSVVPVT
jgi:hypothetical protein